MQSLYIEPVSVVFEKNAAEVTLPEDANLWPNEIMQELYKQVPYIADFEPDVKMDRVDAERGYGFGHVEVRNKTELQSGAAPAAMDAVGVHTVRIPVIIKDRKLFPFDVIVTADSKMLPLNEGRMRQALFRPQAFDVTSRTPGDMSMVGQLYPPYRQNYGFGGGGVGMSVGMGKESSAKKCPKCGSMEKCSCGMGKEASRAWRRAIQAGKLDPYDFMKRVPASPGAHPVYPNMLQEVANRTNLEKMNYGFPGTELFRRTNTAQAGRNLRNAPTPDVSTIDRIIASREKGHSPYHLSKFDSKKVMQERRANLAELDKSASGGVANSTLREVSGSIKKMVPKWKVGSVIAAILPTINIEDHTKFASSLEDPGLQALYVNARAFTAPALSKLAKYQPVDLSKTASAVENATKPDVMQVTKLARGYRVKVASSKFWSPLEKVADRGEVVRLFGEKIALAADATGSVTLATGADVKEDPESPESGAQVVSSFGVYRVKDVEGQELVGYVFPNLIDVDGTPLPIALFTNGSESAIQESIAGELVGKDSGLVFGPSKGHGMFVRQLPNGAVDAMVPMTVKATFSEGVGKKLHVETYDGRELFVEQQPNIKHPVEMEGSCLVPEDFKWMPLGGEDVVLVDHPDEWGQSKQASRAYASVVVRAGGDNSFSLEGMPLSKFASEDRSFLSLDDTLFLLAGMGTNLNYASEKLAQSLATSSPVQVRVGRIIKTAEERRSEASLTALSKIAHVPNLRRSLIKEAAFIQDPTAVDTVLSVGFINPENIMTFVSYLPQLDQTQGRLCELLVAARMGMSDVPTSPLEKSIKSLEEVIDGLKVLAFQKS